MFFTGGCGGGAGTAAATTTTTTAGTAAVKKFHPHKIDLCADRNYFFGRGRVSFRIPVYGLFYLGKVRCCVYIVVLLYGG